MVQLRFSLPRLRQSAARKTHSLEVYQRAHSRDHSDLSSFYSPQILLRRSFVIHDALDELHYFT